MLVAESLCGPRRIPSELGCKISLFLLEILNLLCEILDLLLDLLELLLDVLGLPLDLRELLLGLFIQRIDPLGC